MDISEIILYFEKKKSCKSQSEPTGFLEVPPRFELGNRGFADPCLTTWLWYHIREKEYAAYSFSVWSG